MPRPAGKRLARPGLFPQRLAEPGPGVLPVPVVCRPRGPQGLPGVRDGQPAEQVEVGDLGRGRVVRREAGERVVQRQDEVGVGGEPAGPVEQFDPDPAAARLSRSRSRAWLTRMRRMASAAAAKKWPRPSNCWSPISRRYDSWTRAVASRVWPGASAAMRAAASVRNSSYTSGSSSAAALRSPA